jgi:hypothetical protein
MGTQSSISSHIMYDWATTRPNNIFRGMHYFSDSQTDKTFWYGYQTGTVKKRGFVEYTEVSSNNPLSCTTMPEFTPSVPDFGPYYLPATAYFIENPL